MTLRQGQRKKTSSLVRLISGVTLTLLIGATLIVPAADARPTKVLRALKELSSNRSAVQFDRFVDQYGPGESTSITDNMVHFGIIENNQRINIVFANLVRADRVAVTPPGSAPAVVGSHASHVGAKVAINGNFFGPWDGPVVSDGVVYGGDDHYYTALFGFTADRNVIVDHHREINDSIPELVVNGISGHPTLIYDGERQAIGNDPAFSARHPRTIIGSAASGEVLILVTVDGRRPGASGMTGDEAAGLMVSLGAEQALLLDGGGSTTMWIEGRGVVNVPSGMPRPVGNELAIVDS